jgi:hypothetical protein
MTEQEWLLCQEPQEMIQWLRDAGKLVDRKAQLFAVACCRRIWRLLLDERSRTAVEVAEQFAEGKVGLESVMAAWVPAWTVANEAEEVTLGVSGDIQAAAMAAGHALSGATLAAANTACVAACSLAEGLDEDSRAVELCYQADLLRDLFGPLPFRAVKMEVSWRTPAVLALAGSVYEEGRFEVLPILADDLEEAGCDDGDILGHLRRPGAIHARGCFVLDLVLNKE